MDFISGAAFLLVLGVVFAAGRIFRPMPDDDPAAKIDNKEEKAGAYAEKMLRKHNIVTKPDVVYIFAPPPAFNLKITSCMFSLKVIAWLTMSGIPHRVINAADAAQVSPKGSCPWIYHQGRAIADSTFIIKHLCQQYPDKNPDALLTAEQKAVTLFIDRTLENHLALGINWSRYINDENWNTVRKELVEPKVPACLRWMMPNSTRHSMWEHLSHTDVLKHKRDERIDIFRDDFQAISNYLGTKDFMLGGALPSGVDATCYAWLTNTIRCTYLRDTLHETARQFENLRDYVDRLHQMWFTDVVVVPEAGHASGSVST